MCMSLAGVRGEKRASPATVGCTVSIGFATVMTLLLSGGVTHAEEPATPAPPTEAGELDGALVAVGQPPVPPGDLADVETEVDVDVADDVDVAFDDAFDEVVAEVVVAVGQPPVPLFTVPDAVVLALW
jgi:hypothetical protein